MQQPRKSDMGRCHGDASTLDLVILAVMLTELTAGGVFVALHPGAPWAFVAVLGILVLGLLAYLLVLRIRKPRPPEPVDPVGTTPQLLPFPRQQAGRDEYPPDKKPHTTG